MRNAGLGRWIFAATLIALGALGLFHGDFTAIWQPVPKHWPLRQPLAYLCAIVALAGGLGLYLRRTAGPAAGLLALYLFVWMLLIKGRIVLVAATHPVVYENVGETAVLVAAAWALFAEAGSGRLAALGFAAGPRGLRLAHILYGLSMIAFGVAHLAYVKETAALVPRWLPAHTGWAWFTGATYIAAGLAIIARIFGRLAARLSALQIGGFTLLVWAPVIASGHAGADDWSEFVVSCALTAGAWVVADSYRAGPAQPIGRGLARLALRIGRRA